LLAAGIELTENLKQLLMSRKQQFVLLHRDDAKQVGGTTSTEPQAPTKSRYEATQPGKPRSTEKVARQPVARRVEKVPAKDQVPAKDIVQECNRKLATLAATVPLALNAIGPPLIERAKPHGCEPYQEQHRLRLEKSYTTGKRVLDAMIRHALAGLSQDVHVLHSVASQIVDQLLEDADHSISATNDLLSQPEIAERGVRMAVLGMAVAVEMGWDEKNIHQVGICGLVHDWGIHRLPTSMRKQERPLSDSERIEFRQHPLHTFQMLESTRHLSDEVRMAVTQIHENPDGSGYPKGLNDSQIHPYAKVLHVVDTYLTLTTETWGRKPFLNYDVMVYLLNQVKAQRIDGEAMRALLNVLALFPIGSQVKLSDDTVARVVRRGKQSYTEPIIQRIDAPHAPMIDLAESDLKIVAPVASQEREELPVDDDLMEQVLWE